MENSLGIRTLASFMSSGSTMVSIKNTNNNLLVNPFSVLEHALVVLTRYCPLTLCVPDKVEDTGFQKSLWVFVHCHVNLIVINHLNLSPLKTQNQFAKVYHLLSIDDAPIHDYKHSYNLKAIKEGLNKGWILHNCECDFVHLPHLSLS